MRNRKLGRFLIFAPFILVIFVTVFGLAVQLLWNWLMPVLFGLPTVTFGQAWGLLGLSWILLGGFRGVGGSARHSRAGGPDHWERWRRWKEMTPEERAALRESLDRAWSGKPSDPAAPGATP
jgi:hypothetical protein